MLSNGEHGHECESCELPFLCSDTHPTEPPYVLCDECIEKGEEDIQPEGWGEVDNRL